MPAKEYDYLLTMQIMSLTEERVIELQKQQEERKMAYDRLLSLHIYEIWEHDLQVFLTELDKYELQEEKDRLAHQANAENKGKGGKGKKVVKGAKATAGGKDAAKKPPQM